MASFHANKFNFYNMRNVLIIVSVLIITTSCKNEHCQNPKDSNSFIDTINEKSIYSEKAMELNEEAVRIIIHADNDTEYKKALVLLDKAIEIDSTFFTAYTNKASVFCSLEEYDMSIETMEHLLNNVKPDYPEAYVFLANLYDKTNNADLAKENYQKAIQSYSKRYIENGEILDLASRAHIIFIIDKEKGLWTIDSLIDTNPSNQELLMYREYMLEYNHQELLNNL